MKPTLILTLALLLRGEEVLILCCSFAVILTGINIIVFFRHCAQREVDNQRTTEQAEELSRL